RSSFPDVHERLHARLLRPRLAVMGQAELEPWLPCEVAGVPEGNTFERNEIKVHSRIRVTTNRTVEKPSSRENADADPMPPMNAMGATYAIAHTLRKRFARARRIRKVGTRNDTARAREASGAGGAKAELKYSRPRAYRTTAEALIQIRGARETNQSSTTSVRSSRRTSPSSANVRATRMRDISRQTTRARITACKGCKEEKVSRRRE